MLPRDKKWVAMFSHTGSEIYNVSRLIDRKPDRVITNKQPGDKTINKQLLKSIANDIVYTDDRPSAEDYDRLLLDDCVVTLHGWMRIVPKRICKTHEIYNLHPGLITKYPELKGADPQLRILDQKKTYTHVGCVIHRVTPGVDEGPVLAESKVQNHYYNVEQISCSLHELATQLWKQFLTQHDL